MRALCSRAITRPGYRWAGRCTGFFMKFLLLAVIAVGLAGCGVMQAAKIDRMQEAEVRELSNDEVCHPFVRSSVVDAERLRRGLSDCSEDHKKCASMGYAAGTSNYLQCRNMLTNEKAVADARQQAGTQALIAAAAATRNNSSLGPDPIPSVLPQQTRCRSTVVAAAVQTVCQ